jgi:predicted MFS family arabinose efflux permease
VGQTVSAFGSDITGVALPLTALILLGATPAQMGLLGALEAAPVLLLGLFAGVWVDRLRRRPLLIAADLGRALLLLAVPLAFFMGILRIELLFVITPLLAALTILFTVAGQSYVPSLVERDNLVEANSKMGASRSVAEIGGPAAGGLLVQAASAPIAVLIDALSFLFSALTLGLIRKPEARPLPDQTTTRNVWREVAEGLRLVLHDHSLRALAACAATFTFFGYFYQALYALYVVQVLGVPEGAYGFLIGAGGAGALLGALLVGRIVRRFGPGPAAAGSLALAGIIQFAIFLPIEPLPLRIAVLAAAQFLGDIAIAVFLINELSLRQALVPDHLLGRATASVQSLVAGVGLAGALVAGVLGSALGPQYTLIIATVGIMLAPLWLIFSPVTRMDIGENRKSENC